MSYKIKSKIHKKKGGDRRGEGKSENSEDAKRRLLCRIIEAEEVEVIYIQ